MDYRRSIGLSVQVNSLELMILQWLSKRQARNESETIRELIRKAGEQDGFFQALARGEVGEVAADQAA